jgi:hypothetical protein
MKNKNIHEENWVIKVSIIAFGIVIIFFVSYWLFFPTITLPKNVTQTGTFGDSFGVLTCLFSGLSSAGVIVAIFMQYAELKLQRTELRENRDVFKLQKEEAAKSAKAQEANVKLTALTLLLEKYKEMTVENNKVIGSYPKQNTNYKKVIKKCQDENTILAKRDTMILDEIEKIIIESGINLPSLPK